MRDFRDAKVMARALREALKAKSVATTHSDCLELVAKMFGYQNWNILAAKVEAARSRAPHAAAGTSALESTGTLYCSFCGKSQHEVRKLISGPTVFICDECVALCNDIIDNEAVLDLFAGDDELAAPTGMRDRPAEALVSDVLRAKKYIQRWRFFLAQIRRKLSMRDGEVPAKGDVLASPRFAYLTSKRTDELVALEQRHARALKGYEDAQRTAVKVLRDGNASTK